ncbi:MAG: hypothetical protein A2932_02075 [Candidatus Spechtbacteria bacterium RIFCSPLOWO2_01_FULL_46_10]|uniref:Pyridine nucleotide-disulfide oxidoreductase domain-containing protein 2 n=1 Tax=Candidatus Spechtbacteria bacterium RIFCSPLOWO2_01_FULL_46_10 TaxID=1802163 RepID=A0A1G2HFM5_9BACT|nr:MAG: hypothetical protein A2932_02075 [Candidatus Spechtbacteria bacterium RIFCSPLOWO2_01_FULL_46_10]
MKKHCIVVIGAGHNGLVAACYLAEAGHHVMVLEKRNIVGGSCVTEETFPGFKISSAAYVNSLFLNKIVDDLRLRDYGYEVLLRNPSSFTPLPDGRYLMLGPNKEFNLEEIAKFSKYDARKYAKYEKVLSEIASFIDTTLTMEPPGLPPQNLSDLTQYLKLAGKLLGLSQKSKITLAKLISYDARLFLDEWFESDALKATLLTDSIIGATNFSGYVLLHHVMGEAGGVRGVWGYQRGGMGNITQALKKAAEDRGVKIYTNHEVKQIKVENGAVRKVDFANGGIVFPDIVVSNTDPKLTFLKLLGPDNCPKSFLRKIANLDFSSASMKVNLALSGVPKFFCIDEEDVGPQHRGTIHIAPGVSYITKAAREGKRGIPSTEPILELTIPSAVDNTLAPAGKHIMNIFVQFAPYHLREGSWDEIKQKYFEKNIMDALKKYIVNIENIIEGVQILSPLDLEREFSLTEGNIFHGAMTLGQLFSMRPVRGYANYRTPVKGLYLCGAGAHPGGGVMGAAGYNAARAVLEDVQKEKP